MLLLDGNTQTFQYLLYELTFFIRYVDDQRFHMVTAMFKSNLHIICK